MLLVTGGAGFIGSNFILRWLEHANESIVNLDALTYAGNLENLRPLEHDPRYRFVRGNVCDAALVADLFERFRPRAVVHFAAESHVDRSITGPSVFVETNVTGTTTLLNTAYRYWLGLPDEEKANFRFLNVSTDEVYGSMDRESPPAKESTPFDPSSPYSASKAAADQFGRAYARTYGLPVLTVRCTNNYGPRQYPEKLTPSIITRAVAGFRSQSTDRADRSATGSTWMTFAQRSVAFSREGAPGTSTTWGPRTNGKTSHTCEKSAPFSTN